MESMHAPTVASGPTAVNGVRELDLSKLTLPGLIEEKERLESELEALGSILESVSESCTSSQGTMLTPSLRVLAWSDHAHYSDDL